MNSIWNKNIARFRERFPDLSKIYADIFTELSAESCAESEGEIGVAAASLIDECGIEVFDARVMAKNGHAQKTIRENNVLLHSAYNPENEAAKLIAVAGKPEKGVVFYGFGLGYAPIAAAQTFPDTTIILIEPDIRRLALALTFADWEAVFSSPIVLLVGAEQSDIITVLERMGLPALQFFALPAYMKHNPPYFAAIQELVERNKQKHNINRRTTEKFGSLWLKNSCRNLHLLPVLDGVNKFFNALPADGELRADDGKLHTDSLAACVLAAGPSLDLVLPFLRAIKERCVLICVDTALRACLRCGVEPDFIALADPQFWNARHIDGLSSPSSILITEIAAYPSVMRFACREIVLFDSIYPLGTYFTQAMTEAGARAKGELAAGGSVTSSAWDFARALGCTEIFLAGLDLGFPAKQTHVRGSLFEERSHEASSRIAPAETASARMLFSATQKSAVNYAGAPIACDERMNVYAWWFESKIAAFPAHKTYSLTQESRAIPGVSFFPLETLLARPAVPALRAAFFDAAQKRTETNAEQNATQDVFKCAFEHALSELRQKLAGLKEKAASGVALCDKTLAAKHPDYRAAFDALAAIDADIHKNAALRAASLVFNSDGLLENRFTNDGTQAGEQKDALATSRILYTDIVRAADTCLSYLQPETAS